MLSNKCHDELSTVDFVPRSREPIEIENRRCIPLFPLEPNQFTNRGNKFAYYYFSLDYSYPLILLGTRQTLVFRETLKTELELLRNRVCCDCCTFPSPLHPSVLNEILGLNEHGDITLFNVLIHPFELWGCWIARFEHKCPPQL